MSYEYIFKWWQDFWYAWDAYKLLIQSNFYSKEPPPGSRSWAVIHGFPSTRGSSTEFTRKLHKVSALIKYYMIYIAVLSETDKTWQHFWKIAQTLKVYGKVNVNPILIAQIRNSMRFTMNSRIGCHSGYSNNGHLNRFDGPPCIWWSRESHPYCMSRQSIITPTAPPLHELSQTQCWISVSRAPRHPRNATLSATLPITPWRSKK